MPKHLIWLHLCVCARLPQVWSWTAGDYWKWAWKVYRPSVCFDSSDGWCGGACPGGNRGQFQSSFATASDNVWEPSPCVFVFAGSDDWKDWEENIWGAFTTQTVQKLEGGSVQVHSGYFASASRLDSWVAGRLGENQCGSCATFVGHSLGGAIATIFQVKYGGKAVTFGAPPVFSQDHDCVAGGDHSRFFSDHDAVAACSIGHFHGQSATRVKYAYYGAPARTSKEGCQSCSKSGAFMMQWHCFYAWVSEVGSDDGRQQCRADTSSTAGGTADTSSTADSSAASSGTNKASSTAGGTADTSSTADSNAASRGTNKASHLTGSSGPTSSSVRCWHYNILILTAVHGWALCRM